MPPTPSETMPSGTTPPSVAAAALIESMKEKTALRAQLVKDMKEGFAAIADGMMAEDYNNIDELDDLAEKLRAVMSLGRL